MMMFPKRPAWRSRDYLDYVMGMSCLSCMRTPPSDPHHFMEGTSTMARKPDDMFTVPLCRECHTAWHMEGCLPMFRDHHYPRLASVALMYQRQAQLMADWIREHGMATVHPAPPQGVF